MGVVTHILLLRVSSYTSIQTAVEMHKRKSIFKEAIRIYDIVERGSVDKMLRRGLGLHRESLSRSEQKTIRNNDGR